MAVILGTGTNAAYMERAEAVASVARNRNNNGSGGGSEGSGTETAEMAINTEWSDLRLPGRVRLLQEDLDMDAASNNPGFQIYEKLISGMHLGESQAETPPALYFLPIVNLPSASPRIL